MTDLTQAIADAAFNYLDGNMMVVHFIDGTPMDVRALSDAIARDVAAVVEAHLRPVVTTVAELDALPHGSVVRSEQGGIWEKLDDIEGGWYETGSGSWHPSTDISLPATVLYRPAD